MCQLHESESQKMGGGWVEDGWRMREGGKDGGTEGLA